MPVQPLIVAASTAKNSNSGGSGIFLLLILLLGVFLLFRFSANQRRARARATEMRSAVATGARVMTSSGLYGTVTATGDDTVELEVADGVVVMFAKAAITRVISSDDVSGTGVPGVDVPEVYAEQPAGDPSRSSSEG